MAQRLPTRCNPDDRLNQRVLAGTMIKAKYGFHTLTYADFSVHTKATSASLLAALCNANTGLFEV